MCLCPSVTIKKRKKHASDPMRNCMGMPVKWETQRNDEKNLLIGNMQKLLDAVEFKKKNQEIADTIPNPPKYNKPPMDLSVLEEEWGECLDRCRIYDCERPGTMKAHGGTLCKFHYYAKLIGKRD